MRFNRLQLAAITNLALAMAKADGKVEQTELLFIALELNRFGINEEDANAIINGADEMNSSTALSIISTMKDEEKRYVTAYLGTMIAADRDINDKEVALWGLISTLCDLPTMTINEAIELISNL